jgi:hypothetical protein
LRGYRGNRNRLRPSRSRSPLPGHARFADKAPRDARKESGAGRGIAGCCGRWRTGQASFSFPPVRLPHPRIESDAPARGRTCTSVRPSRLPLPPVRECFVRSPSPRHYDIARILPAIWVCFSDFVGIAVASQASSFAQRTVDATGHTRSFVGMASQTVKQRTLTTLSGCGYTLIVAWHSWHSAHAKMPWTLAACLSGSMLMLCPLGDVTPACPWQARQLSSRTGWGFFPGLEPGWV